MILVLMKFRLNTALVSTIREYAKCLVEEICRAVPFRCAITGRDTVSAFSGRGKKIAWNVWGVSEEATRGFIK